MAEVAEAGGDVAAQGEKRRRDDSAVDEEGGKKKKSKKDKKDKKDKKKKKHKKDKHGDKDKDKEKKKKKKADRPAGAAYIDEDAELSGEDLDTDDDEEEEEDDGEEMKGFVVEGADDGGEAAEAAAAERQMRVKEKKKQANVMDSLRDQREEAMGHAELDQHMDDLKMQAEMKRLEQKYGVDDDEEGIGLDELGVGDELGEGAAALAARPLPSVKDPKLWLLKCDPGTEAECVFALLKRFNSKDKSKDDRLYIHSAFTTPGSKNYVYIEADKKIHVERAIRGLTALKWWSLKLVPIEEMVAAVTVKVVEVQVRSKQWVRMKRGIYIGDLAQVVTSADQGTNVTVRIIPRLDLVTLAEEHRAATAAKDKKTKPKREKKKAGPRPMARLFDKNEVTDVVGPETVSRKKVGMDESYYYYFNNKKFKHGFLYMTTKVQQLQTEDVLPTMDEIDRFQSRLGGDEEEESRDDDKKDDQLQPLETKATKFQKDDRVVVVSGDLNHLTGRVMSIFKDTITIMPDDKDLTDPLKFQTNELKKFFQVGDHVKVIDGKFKNETGLIVRVNVDDSTVVVFSDISSREMVVYAQDVVESTEVSTGRDSLGNFELHDMVTLNRDDRGVIVKIDIGSFKLLTNRNTIVSVRLQDIGKKMGSRLSSALDSQGNQVSQDDVVRIVSGPNRDRQGVVKHLYRGTLFIWSRFINENSGVMVAQGKHVQLMGQTGVNKPQTPASPFHNGAAGAAGRGAGGRGGPMGAPVGGAPLGRGHVAARDPLLSATVRVTMGPYKGCWGIVEGVIENQVRIELASVMKTITVPRTSVKQFDNIKPGGHDSDYTGAQTPLLGASRTPAWSELGDRTPAHTGDGPGGWTPARSMGAMTPSHDVWNPRTPHHNPRTPQADDSRDLDAEEMGMEVVRVRSAYTAPATPITPNPMPYAAASSSSSSAAAHNVQTPVPYSPAPAIHTPMTPHTSVPITPYTSAPPVTPHTPHTPHTPASGMAHHTPHTPHLVPVTPGGMEVAVAPFYPQMMVIIEGRKDSDGKDKEGSIVRFDRADRWLVLVDGEQLSFGASQLHRVSTTQAGRRVVLLSGEHAGKYGVLIAMDGQEGIINVDKKDGDEHEDPEDGDNVVIQPADSFAAITT